MLREIDIIDYVPPFLQEFKEFQVLCETENKEIKKLWSGLETVLNNQFIKYADEDGVKRMEDIIGIIPKLGIESLEFRKDRVLNRMTMFPPFSFPFLLMQLDLTIGSGKYKAYIDHEKYTLYLESSAVDQSWYNEISFTINKVKPCNIVFVNKPLNNEALWINESIGLSSISYNYRLGEWRLGEKSIATLTDKAMIKKEDAMSIQNALIEGLAATTIDKITGVLVNDQLAISEFSVKEVQGQDGIIEYTVKQDEMVLVDGAVGADGAVITNVKLLDEEGIVLSSANVYVPVKSDALVKHTIRIREGV